MSSISTLSTFYYGHDVTSDNYSIPFDEGGSELFATLNIGNYSLTEYAEEIERALNVAGALTYTVTVNRTSRKITIAATGVFTLRCNTGSTNAVGAWSMMGFATIADKTGLNTYLADNASGSEYRCQGLLDDYTMPEDNELKESAVVNESASGVIQIVHFGDGKRMECNIRT
jgi:hypothetical protein